MTDEPIETTPTEPQGELDPAAETVAEPAAAAEAEVAEPVVVEPAVAEPAIVEPAAAREPSVPWWPFVAYLMTWVAYAAGLVIVLRSVADGTAVTDAAVYPTVLFVGILLAVCGPALTLGIWASAATRSQERGSWLFAAVAMRGALATLAGTIIWWAALVLVDVLRTGRVW